MVLHSTFPTEIWVEIDHKCKVDNESLAKIIINKSRTEPSRELSNVGGWQSNDDLSITEELLARGTTATGGLDSFEGYPELEELLTRVGRPKGTSPISSKHTNWHTVENEYFTTLITYVTQSFNEIYKHNNYIEGLKVVIVNMWANINNHLEFNKSHLHPDSDWSFVYYVKVTEDSGSIVFCDPRVRRIMNVHDDILKDYSNDSQHSTYRISPLNGRLVIFPSYLEHYVEPNPTHESRISISGNIRMREE